MKQQDLAKAIESSMTEFGLRVPERPNVNTIQSFFFSDDDVLEANRGGRLLMLDLDVGNICDLGCDFCYVSTGMQKRGRDYVEKTTERIKGIIDEGVDLGLRVIKIVGAGEPFLFPGLLKILEYTHNKGVGSLVFTAGHIIGNDERARKIFEHSGVTDGSDLARRVHELGSSVVVKFMTFNDELQRELVAPKSHKLDYARARDKGLLCLIEEGFNAFSPTRLGVNVLIQDQTYKEARDIYSFFVERNIFAMMVAPVNCGGSTMINGIIPPFLSRDHLLEATRKIHEYCTEVEMETNQNGPYVAGPLCNQLNHAMHIGYDSTVKMCPGAKDGIDTYEPGKLREIWERNQVRREYQGRTSNGCPPRDHIMPVLFRDSSILQKV